MPFEENAPRLTVNGEVLIGVEVVLLLNAPELSAEKAGATDFPKFVPEITTPEAFSMRARSCCARPNPVFRFQT